MRSEKRTSPARNEARSAIENHRQVTIAELSQPSIPVNSARGARALKRAILESWHDYIITDESADALIRFFGLGGA